MTKKRVYNDVYATQTTEKKKKRRQKKCAACCSDLPINGLSSLFDEQFVGLTEVFASEESSAGTESRGMHGLQRVVLRFVHALRGLLCVLAPQKKHDPFALLKRTKSTSKCIKRDRKRETSNEAMTAARACKRRSVKGGAESRESIDAPC